MRIRRGAGRGSGRTQGSRRNLALCPYSDKVCSHGPLPARRGGGSKTYGESELNRGFDSQPPRRPDIFGLGMWHWGTPACPLGRAGVGHGEWICYVARCNHAVIAGQCRAGTMVSSTAGTAGLPRSARSPRRGHHVPALPVQRRVRRAGPGLLLPRRCQPASLEADQGRPGCPDRRESRPDSEACYRSFNGI